MASPLSESEIAAELAAFEIALPSSALAQLSRYLELLLHWNRRINLTGIRDPKTIVRRLFGESLAIARVVELRGWLVDVGSGAGFPGLALKLAAPDLRVTLVEARQKKCAFLREVTRQCKFTGVEVVPMRFEEWSAGAPGRPQLFTTRAVAVDRSLLLAMSQILAPGGRIAVLTGLELSDQIKRNNADWAWSVSVAGVGAGSAIMVGKK